MSEQCQCHHIQEILRQLVGVLFLTDEGDLEMAHRWTSGIRMATTPVDRKYHILMAEPRAMEAMSLVRCQWHQLLHRLSTDILLDHRLVGLVPLDRIVLPPKLALWLHKRDHR